MHKDKKKGQGDHEDQGRQQGRYDGRKHCILPPSSHAALCAGMMASYGRLYMKN